MASQGPVNREVSLSAHICGKTSFEELTSDVEHLIEQLCEAEIETDTATDLQAVQRAINRERRLRFNLKLLENVRSEKIMGRHMSSIVSLVNKLQATTSVKLQRLECQIDAFISKVEVNYAISAEVHSLQEQLDEVHEVVSESEGLGQELRHTVLNLAERHNDLQRTVDTIDNRQRARNAVVYGLTGGHPKKQVNNLLAARPHLLQSLENAHYIGKANSARRPTLLRFQTVSSKEEFLRLSRTKDFREENPHVSAASDESVRTRVGGSRLAAAAPELKKTFPGIIIKSRNKEVLYKGERFSAADFVPRFIQIHQTRFDITAAAEKNDDFEPTSTRLFSVPDHVLRTRFRQ
jgi:hypothetical protein